MTFSITGFDPTSGMLGVAVATRYWAVGSRVPYVRAGLAALAVQAYAQPYLGYDTLRLMASEQLSGPEALERVLAVDPGRDWRQVGLADRFGNVYAYTGSETAAWSGHRLGRHCAGAGNMLVGEATVLAMIETFEARDELELPDRLVAALVAGQAAGGDRRGQQSAAVYVTYLMEAPYLDLRVDDHPAAVGELARLAEATRQDALVRSRRFAAGRDSPPVEEYRAHQARLAVADRAAANDPRSDAKEES